MTQVTEKAGALESFTMLGGPLHQLGIRLRLVRPGSDTLRLGLAIGVLAWVALMSLAAFEGIAGEMFTLSGLGMHVRALLAIPLFFLCESWFDPEVGRFVGLSVRSGVVPEGEVPALEAAIARTTRLKDSWLPDTVCLLAAVLLPWIAGMVGMVGASEAKTISLTASRATLVGWWVIVVSLPLFRFLMFRWLWRLGLWWYFLGRMARLDLNLVPTHPDGSAGLGYLEVVHLYFIPLIAALSAVQAAMIADQVAAGTLTIASMTPSLSWILAMDGVLFLGPMLLFGPKLWACRRAGLRDYTALASKYVTDFDRKWVHPDGPPGEPLLGTSDVQSLADLASSVDLVRGMRMAPFGVSLVASLAAAAVLPLAPLALLQYPAADVVRALLKGILGL